MRLEPEQYLDHIRAESARFRAVLDACDPEARVPSCPDWNATDLAWHLTEVQALWTRAIIDRPTKPDEGARPERPEEYAAILRAFDEHSAALAQALDGVADDEAAWNWSTDQTVGFILRRQAHEALIHRVDAELTAGSPSELPAELAADGVEETLDVMYGFLPPWGSWEALPHYGRIDCTDTGDEFWVQLGLFSGTSPDGEVTEGEEDIHLVAEPDDVEPDFVVDGPAASLDLWLWKRGDDSQLSVAGDREVHGRFLQAVRHPIN